MKTLQELKTHHEQELREAEQELAIAAFLPAEATHIHVHKNYVGVSYQKPFPNRYGFREAYELFKLFTPIESQHWKSGCLSCQPEEINQYAKEERAVLDGTSIAEIKLSAGRNYESHALVFWARILDRLLQVCIEIRPSFKWLPDVQYTYNQSGVCFVKRCNPAFIGEDSRRKWWSPDGSYQFSYYWADEPNFASFASTEND